MSNTQKRKGEFVVWDELTAEAGKSPFNLTLPDGETLVIKQLTGRQVWDIEDLARKGASSRDQLKAIIGSDDAFERLEPLIEDAPGDAIGLLVTRISEHFGYSVGEGPASQS